MTILLKGTVYLLCTLCLLPQVSQSPAIQTDSISDTLSNHEPNITNNSIRELHNEMKTIRTTHKVIKKDIDHLIRNQQDLDSILTDLNTLMESLKTSQSNSVVDMNRRLTATKHELQYRYLILIVAILTCFMIMAFLYIIHNRNKKFVAVEEIIALGTKMTQLLENQLTLSNNMTTKRDYSEKTEKSVHSLPIGVGVEIFRMRRRIANMDKTIKGLDALEHALARLEDELTKRGYTIKDLTGQTYIDGLTVKVINTFEQKGVEPGKKIIARMLTPQIYYNGVMISPGEIEIAVSPKNNSVKGDKND